MRAWTLACLSLWLTACGTTVQVVKPSAFLTADCAYPVLEGDTYRDVVILAERRGEALLSCTERLRALRDK